MSITWSYQNNIIRAELGAHNATIHSNRTIEELEDSVKMVHHTLVMQDASDYFKDLINKTIGSSL